MTTETITPGIEALSARSAQGGDDFETINLMELIGPTPKQQLFLWAMDHYRFLLFGGAAGGGKSYILRWGAVYQLVRWHQQMQERADALRNPGPGKGRPTAADIARADRLDTMSRGIEVGIFCETYNSLVDRHLSKIDKEFPEWMGRLRQSDSKNIRYELCPELGGGVINFRNLDNAGKYKSTEFAMIGVDELTMNTYETFNSLRFRLRWPGIDRPIFAGCSNPGSIGHNWVRSLWIDRQFPKEFAEKGLDKEFYYIPARVSDNPHLPPEYGDDLYTLPEELRRAYLDGSWDVFSGQVFEEWRADKHVIAPFDIPRHWKRYCSMDWGFARPFAIYWFAVDEDGYEYCYREFYGCYNNSPNVGLRLDATSVARKIKQIESGAGEEDLFVYRVADPAIWQQNGYDRQFLCMADKFAAEKVFFERGNNNRIQGKLSVHGRLRWQNIMDVDEDSGEYKEYTPILRFFSSCKHMIRTLPSLPYDENKPEDVDTNSEDHCLAGDTLVVTRDGPVPIANLVTQSGEVLTHEGAWEKFDVGSTRLTRKDTLVYTLFLDNGSSVTQTSDHRYLLADGCTWKMLKELQERDELFEAGRRARTGPYHPDGSFAGVFRGEVLPLWEVFPEEGQETASCGLGGEQRRGPEGDARPSQGRGSVEQRLGEPGAQDTARAPERAQQGARPIESGCGDAGGCEGMAQFGGGSGLAQPTREGSVGRTSDGGGCVRRLRQEVPNESAAQGEVLPSELQGGSRQVGIAGASGDPRKAFQGPRVVKIEPAGTADVYCMTIDRAHSFAIMPRGSNAMILSANCYDALRYFCMLTPQKSLAPRAPQRRKDWYERAAERQESHAMSRPGGRHSFLWD